MRQPDGTSKHRGISQRSKPSGPRERYGSSDRTVEGSPSSTAISRPPVILMKPQRRDEDEEEWPSINKSTTVVRTQQQYESKTTLSSAGTSLCDYPAAKIGNKCRLTRTHRLCNQRPFVFLNNAESEKSVPRVLQQGYQQQKFTEARALSDNAAERRERQLNGGIKLITESMEWSDIALEHLSDNADFFVVGIIGPQGVGKSTLMSMIGGNDPFDMYRQYIFRPACKECTETSGHQTQGVQFFVNENRIVLLDSQAILSPSVMNLLINNDRRYSYDCSTFENYVEMEAFSLSDVEMTRDCKRNGDPGNDYCLEFLKKI
uniref:Protein SMG9 n=1 Tax=Romanomermis culicivorax TaxID=13658 RepID=A0A915JXX5_ROMCU